MIYVWGVARAAGAEVLLRMEDHDRTRCRPAYEAAILDDMDWLGFTPDLGASASFRAGACPLRQSDCGPAYQAALDTLISQGLLYACDCSRRILSARMGPGVGALAYDGHCRARGLPLDTPACAIRTRLDMVALNCFDLFLDAPILIDPVPCWDPILRDRHGCWTYHFAVVLDDFRQHIDTVVRGADLAGATPMQTALGRVLGRAVPPRHAHHPLITDASGAKLSKRDFARPLRDLRADGAAPEAVIGLAAWRVGLQDNPAPLDAAAAADLAAQAAARKGRLQGWLAGFPPGPV